MALLEIRHLSKIFGGLTALNQLDLDVQEGEILGIIGPNGAGKTTLFNLITGFFPPTLGTVRFKGEDITGLKADQVARKGIGRTFQASVLFMFATVFENTFSAFHMHYKQPGWKAFLRMPSARVEERAMEERVNGILEFMGLAHLKDELAINLPHGYQRLLGVALALSINPSLLLLDEPATGMNPVEKETMVGLIKKMRDNGSTIVIIEHDMKAMMSLCDRFAVLNFGQKIAEGDPRQVIDQKEVAEAYLGRGV